jgi:hypothetical protein
MEPSEGLVTWTFPSGPNEATVLPSSVRSTTLEGVGRSPGWQPANVVRQLRATRETDPSILVSIVFSVLALTPGKSHSRCAGSSSCARFLAWRSRGVGRLTPAPGLQIPPGGSRAEALEPVKLAAVSALRRRRGAPRVHAVDRDAPGVMACGCRPRRSRPAYLSCRTRTGRASAFFTT